MGAASRRRGAPARADDDSAVRRSLSGASCGGRPSSKNCSASLAVPDRKSSRTCSPRGPAMRSTCISRPTAPRSRCCSRTSRTLRQGPRHPNRQRPTSSRSRRQGTAVRSDGLDSVGHGHEAAERHPADPRHAGPVRSRPGRAGPRRWSSWAIRRRRTISPSLQARRAREPDRGVRKAIDEAMALAPARRLRSRGAGRRRRNGPSSSPSEASTASRRSPPNPTAAPRLGRRPGLRPRSNQDTSAGQFLRHDLPRAEPRIDPSGRHARPGDHLRPHGRSSTWRTAR